MHAGGGHAKRGSRCGKRPGGPSKRKTQSRRVTRRRAAGQGAKRNGNRRPRENSHVKFRSSLIHKIGKKRGRPKRPSSDVWAGARDVHAGDNYSATERSEAVGRGPSAE